jgi:hypothetical protein
VVRTAIAAADVVADAGEVVCVVGPGDRLAAFANGTALFDRVERRVTAVAAVPDGCVVLADGTARRIRASRADDVLAEATAVAASGDRVLVAGHGTLRVDGIDREIDEGATALAEIDDRTVAVGHDDGHVEFVALDGSTAALPISADKARKTPVTSLVGGPAGTLAIGYASGNVAVVELATGARLHAGRLHGRVEHLRIHERVLYASTDLGDATSIDVADVARSYCEVLREVWRDVPVVLEDERLVHRDPPTSHECAR